MTKVAKSEQLKVNSAPAAAGPTVGEVVEIIDLELLDASPLNPRRTMNEADLAELAASIREHGIQVPLLVRPLRCVDVTFEDGSTESIGPASRADCSELLLRPGSVETCVSDRYEIVAGHRRSEAATLAGKKSVPCIVRELTDEEAAEIALVDNLQRVDVSPIEEAEKLGELLNRLHSIPAVALKVGKEQSYIAQRLRLLKLTTWSREALREKLITIDHALLLARLAEAEQNEALKWCIDPQAGKKTPVFDVVKERIKRKNPAVARAAIAAANPEVDLDADDLEELRREEFEDEDDVDEAGRRAVWNRAWECESVQRLKEHIECSSGEVLDRAPWPMEEDWLVLDAGSCLDCPKNTKANTPLFGDLEMGVAVCTDGACFKAKVDAFVVIQGRDEAKRAANLAGKPPVPGAFEPMRVSWKATMTAPRMERSDPGANIKPDVPKRGQVFKQGQWREATKKCEHAQAAVTVDWSDANNRGHMGGDGKLRKPGEILQICIEPKCKVHPKAYGKAASASNEASDRAKREEQDKKRKEAILLENQLRMGWAVTAIGKVKSLPDAVIRKLVMSQLGQGSNESFIGKHLVKDPRSKLQNAAIGGVDFAQAAAALFIAQNGLNVPEWYEPVRYREEFWAALKLFGVDARKGWEKPKPAKKTPAKPAPKKTAKKPAKKAAKKGGKR